MQQSTSSPLTDYFTPVWKGAIAGCLATVPMTATMFAFQRRLPLWQRRTVPPKRITMGVLRRLGVKQHMSQPEAQKTAWVAHFAYGTGMGAAYGAISPRVPVPSLFKGIVFGLAVWAGGYLGWLPALDLPGSAPDESPQHNAQMIAAHLVWGSAMGIILRAVKAS